MSDSFKLPISRRPAAILACILIAVCGCNSGGKDGRFAVSGKVTVDGAPLADGRITFLNLAEGGSTASAKITSGEYTIPREFGAKVGEQVVQIEAYRKSSKRVQPPGYLSAEQVAEGTVEQYLPAKYNTQSELKVEISADGANEHNFDL